MKLKPYKKTKPSGVEWLGDVPEHWDTKKVTYGFSKIGSGTTPKSDTDEFYDGDVPWVTTSELRETVIIKTKECVTQSALTAYSALRLYPEGTLLFAMYGATIGRLGVLGLSATLNQACCAFAKPTLFDTRFVFYWLWMRRPILISLSTGGGQPNLSQDDLRQIRISTPPLPEQRSIAAYLDRETGRIDSLVSKKRELIERLKEKRTALISRTVTRGLPPAAAKAAGLPVNPKMKDSGIEWLGEIPGHWSRTSLKRVVSVRGRIGFRGYTTDDLVDEADGVLALGGTNLTKVGRLDLRKRTYLSWFKYEESPEIKVELNDLIIGQRGTCGDVVLIDREIGPATINPSLVLLKQPKIDSGFLCYWLMGRFVQSIFDTYLSATAVPMLTQQQIGDAVICHPPQPEQIAISAYLDTETAKLDALVGKVEEAVERLQEYRTALITAAVTGKIDVRKEIQ